MKVGYPIKRNVSVLDRRRRLSIHTKERRYSTARWRRLRLRVLSRDLGRCRVVEGCPTPATVADHIIPASWGMTDAQFFNIANLRAACRRHNLARGFAAQLEGSIKRTDTAVVSKDYT